MNNFRIIARNSLRRRDYSLRSPPSRSFCNLSQESNRWVVLSCWCVPSFAHCLSTWLWVYEKKHRPSYGIAFDIDGVILLGSSPVGGSPGALRRLYDDSGISTLFNFRKFIKALEKYPSLNVLRFVYREVYLCLFLMSLRFLLKVLWRYLSYSWLMVRSYIQLLNIFLSCFALIISMKIIWLPMTGGGLPESERASEMTHLLGVPVSPFQV